jgi:DNA-binding NarL/FixJ family response regulator
MINGAGAKDRGRSRRAGPQPLATVYVISEVRLFREGLTGMLRRDGMLAIIGHGCYASGFAEIPELRPEIVLLEYDGSECRVFCRELHTIVPDLRLVAVAVGKHEADVMACAEAGISGFVGREASVDEVVDAVRASLAGEIHCSPRLSGLLFARLANLSRGSVEETVGTSLTPREREIADLVARGLSNKEIAIRLRVSPATIKNHVHNILQKLRLQRRGEVTGLRIPLPPPQVGAATVRSGRL